MWPIESWKHLQEKHVIPVSYESSQPWAEWCLLKMRAGKENIFLAFILASFQENHQPLAVFFLE